MKILLLILAIIFTLLSVALIVSSISIGPEEAYKPLTRALGCALLGLFCTITALKIDNHE